jgi:hypothetical protein
VQWEAAGLLYVGRFAEIAELTKTGQQRAERFGLGRSRGSMLGANRASALEAIGRWDEALEVLEPLQEWDGIAELWRELGDPYELADTLVTAAQVALSTSNKSGARMRLREARSLATTLRAKPLLTRIEKLAVRAQLTGELQR